MNTEIASKRPGTKPTQFRLDDSFLSRLEKLAELHSEETGMNEDRTSVIRRLIAKDFRERTGVSNRE